MRFSLSWIICKSSKRVFCLYWNVLELFVNRSNTLLWIILGICCLCLHTMKVKNKTSLTEGEHWTQIMQRPIEKIFRRLSLCLSLHFNSISRIFHTCPIIKFICVLFDIIKINYFFQWKITICKLKIYSSNFPGRGKAKPLPSSHS